MKGQAQHQARGSQPPNGQQLVAKGRPPRRLGNAPAGESKEQGEARPWAARADSDLRGRAGTARRGLPVTAASLMARTWTMGDGGQEVPVSLSPDGADTSSRC